MDEIIKFFIEIGKLKGMPRRGGLSREVKNPESIAEHIFQSYHYGTGFWRRKKIRR